MDGSAMEIRYAEWFARIQDWSQSGMGKNEYCKAHGIAPKTFYYYQRKIRKHLAEMHTAGITPPAGIQGLGLLPEECVSKVSKSSLSSLGALPDESVSRPQIVKLELPEQGYDPHSNPAGTVHFSVNGTSFVVEEDISPSFLTKLIRATGSDSR